MRDYARGARRPNRRGAARAGAPEPPHQRGAGDAEGSPSGNEIRVRTRLAGPGRVAIEVSDTGHGIPPEHLERIFEPFFTTKPVGVGTGLGLWVCRNIVEAAGGGSRVESVPGEGTVFRDHAALGGRGAARGRGTARSGPGRAARARRVLVVDDDALVGKAVRRMLELAHAVVLETSARAALARLAAGERFDAIVCDLMMPGMTGMELHAELARTRPRDAERVIFLTGGAFTDEAVGYLEAVPNERLEKPFDAATLTAAIRRLVQGSQAGR